MTTVSKPTLWHDAFYRFVTIDDVPTLIAELREICEQQELLGSILVATEGINGMLAGIAPALDAFREALAANERFAAMAYKRSHCETAPFNYLRLRHKKEIVPLGIPGVDAAESAGTNVTPQQWRALIARDDVVLIDNRNDFEVRLGKFMGAKNPQVKHFRDFPDYIKNNLPDWQGKKVAMYCTGGIRCEKSAGWMAGLGLEVYQLEGGILNYFEQMADADEDFTGECFVFDNRIALDSRLRETATGLEDIFDMNDEDDAWRLKRARLLAGEAGGKPTSAAKEAEDGAL